MARSSSLGLSMSMCTRHSVSRISIATSSSSFSLPPFSCQSRTAPCRKSARMTLGMNLRGTEKSRPWKVSSQRLRVVCVEGG